MDFLYSDIFNIVDMFSMNHESEYSNQCYDFLNEHNDISKEWFEMIWDLHLFRIKHGFLKSLSLEVSLKMLKRDLKKLQHYNTK